MTLTRRIVTWVLALVLVGYIVGTVPLLLSVAGHRAAGESWSDILSGFYFRFLLMGLLLYVLVRLNSGPHDAK